MYKMAHLTRVRVFSVDYLSLIKQKDKMSITEEPMLPIKRPDNRSLFAFLTAVPGLPIDVEFVESGFHLRFQHGEFELSGHWDGDNLGPALLNRAHTLAPYAVTIAEEVIEQRHFEHAGTYLIVELRQACPNHPDVIRACYNIMGAECPSKLGIPSDEDVRTLVEHAVADTEARGSLLDAIDTVAPRVTRLGESGSYNLAWAFERIADRFVAVAPDLSLARTCPSGRDTTTFIINRLHELFPGHPRVEAAQAQMA